MKNSYVQTDLYKFKSSYHQSEGRVGIIKTKNRQKQSTMSYQIYFELQYSLRHRDYFQNEFWRSFYRLTMTLSFFTAQMFWCRVSFLSILIDWVTNNEANTAIILTGLKGSNKKKLCAFDINKAMLFWFTKGHIKTYLIERNFVGPKWRIFLKSDENIARQSFAR